MTKLEQQRAELMKNFAAVEERIKPLLAAGGIVTPGMLEEYPPELAQWLLGEYARRAGPEGGVALSGSALVALIPANAITQGKPQATPDEAHIDIDALDESRSDTDTSDVGERRSIGIKRIVVASLLIACVAVSAAGAGAWLVTHTSFGSRSLQTETGADRADGAGQETGSTPPQTDTSDSADSSDSNALAQEYVRRMDRLNARSVSLNSRIRHEAIGVINPLIDRGAGLASEEGTCSNLYASAQSLRDDLRDTDPPAEFSRAHRLFGRLVSDLLVRARALSDGVNAYNSGDEATALKEFGRGSPALKDWRRVRPRFESAYESAKTRTGQ